MKLGTGFVLGIEVKHAEWLVLDCDISVTAAIIREQNAVLVLSHLQRRELLHAPSLAMASICNLVGDVSKGRVYDCLLLVAVLGTLLILILCLVGALALRRWVEVQRRLCLYLVHFHI